MPNHNTTEPLVSIAVPVYGVEKYIERCARSLFEQTYGNIEYVFVDDCSPDQSMEILLRAAEDYPCRKEQIKIVHHQKNMGLACARNTAVSNCSADLLMHVDSDDWIEKDMTEIMVRKLLDTDADIVSVGFIQHNPDGTELSPEPHHPDSYSMTRSLLTPQQSVRVWGRLYRKRLYTEHNIAARGGVNIGEDWQVTPRLAYYAQRVEVVDACAYHYNRENEDAYTIDFLSAFRPKKQREELKSIDCLKEFFKDKEPDLYDCTLRAELIRVNVHLYQCIEHSDKVYFRELADRINDDNRHMWHLLGKTDALSMFIKKHYHLLKIFLAIERLRHPK